MGKQLTNIFNVVQFADVNLIVANTRKLAFEPLALRLGLIDIPLQALSFVVGQKAWNRGLRPGQATDHFLPVNVRHV